MGFTINGTAFAEAGVTRCVRQTTTDGGDACEIGWTGVAQPSISRGDVVTVACDAGGFFKGYAKSAPRRVASGGGGEGWALTLESAWAKLSRTVYTQPWAVEGGTAQLSIVSLGTAADGSWQTVNEAISAALAHAGVSGTVNVSTQKMPRQEMRDITCAAAVRACLRFFPDAMILTDRATGALTITRSAGATVTSTAGKTSLEWAPRPEAQVAGVVITWVTVDTVDGAQVRTFHTDSAGSTTGENVLTFTVDLAGRDVSVQRQPVKTDALPTSETDPILNDWAYKYIEELGAAEPAGGQLECLEFEQTIDAESAVGGTPPAAFERMLVSGALQDWMGEKAAAVTIRLRLKLKVGRNANRKLWRLFFNNGGSNVKEWLVNVTGTTAETGTYENATSSGGGESPPADGLAAEIYSALNSTQPAGTISFVEDEPNPALVAGCRLTVASESLTLARVRNTTADAFSGRTTAQFGPVDQWRTPGDFAELQRAQRGSAPSASYSPASKTDAAAAASVSSGPQATPGMGKGSKAQGVDSDKPAAFFLAENAGTGGNDVKINTGLVMHQDWGDIGETDPTPTSMYKRATVDAATLTVSPGETVWLKVTFTKTDVTGKGPLTDAVTYSVSGGAGGMGGDGGEGGAGGAGGAGGTCDCGGSGSGSGTGELPPPESSGTCDCTATPGEAGSPGLPGLPGQFGQTGSPGSTAEIPVPQKYELKLRVWAVAALTLEASTDPGDGDGETAYFPICRKDDSGDGGYRIEQLHTGILVVPMPTSAVIPA